MIWHFGLPGLKQYVKQTEVKDSQGAKRPNILPARAGLKDKREGRAVFVVAGALPPITATVLHRQLRRFCGRR